MRKTGASLISGVAIALLLSYGIKRYVNALTPKPPAPPVATEP